MSAARALCQCRSCRARPSRGPRLVGDPDDPRNDPPRPVLGGGPHGARAPCAPSRMKMGAPAPTLDADVPARRAPDPATRGELGERPRVKRAITDRDRDLALDHLKIRPVRGALLRFVGRDDFVHGALLEFLNPPADVEPSGDLWRDLDRAVWRFEHEQRRQAMSISLPETFLSIQRQ